MKELTKVRTYISRRLTKLPSSGGSVPEKLLLPKDLHDIDQHKIFSRNFRTPFVFIPYNVYTCIYKQIMQF